MFSQGNWSTNCNCCCCCRCGCGCGCGCRCCRCCRCCRRCRCHRCRCRCCCCCRRRGRCRCRCRRRHRRRRGCCCCSCSCSSCCCCWWCCCCFFHIYVGLPYSMYIYICIHIIYIDICKKTYYTIYKMSYCWVLITRKYIYQYIFIYWDTNAIWWICWNRNPYHELRLSLKCPVLHRESVPRDWQFPNFVGQKKTYSQQLGINVYQCIKLYLTLSDYSQ